MEAGLLTVEGGDRNATLGSGQLYWQARIPNYERPFGSSRG